MHTFLSAAIILLQDGVPAGTPVVDTLVSEHHFSINRHHQAYSYATLLPSLLLRQSTTQNNIRKSESQHFVQLKHSRSDCNFICRTCLPDLGGTGGAPPYVMPFQKHTCPLLISSSQFLFMMVRRTVLLPPCQALIAWVGGMVSLTQSKKPGLMASTKSSFFPRCGVLSCVHLNGLQLWKPPAVKHEHHLLPSPEIQEMPAFAFAAFACIAADVVHSMVLTWFVLLQTPEHLKTETAEESFNPDGLAQRSIKLLKDKFPDIEVSLLL